MEYHPYLHNAIEMASDIHAGQRRFDGSDYINHPLRVMGTVAAQGHTLKTQAVAVLHDAIEDSKGRLTLTDVTAAGYDEDVTRPLELLTKTDEDDDYMLYIYRLAPNLRARAVKKADLFDNLDLTGLQNPSKDHILRLEKYGNSLLYLARFPLPRV